MRSKANTHEDLEAWQVAVDLAVEVYRCSIRFPREEKFGMTSQIRSAAISVSSNIAEGTGRSSQREMLHFLSIARGSLREVESLLSVAQRLEFLGSTEVQLSRQLAGSAGRLISGLRRSLKS